MQDTIIIRGAREHNLKDLDLELPRHQFIVITGLSGSGKSSLAFDTIYAEGQRRYVESLSSYARQFLGQMEKPQVDSIEGLSPAISIDQRTTSKNPRSTVGTVTEIHDYLRLLYARVGKPHCSVCKRPISSQSLDEMVDRVMEFEEGTKIQILSPLVRGRKGEHQRVLQQVQKEGYVRVKIDGENRDLQEEISLDKNRRHTIHVVVDRLIIRKGLENRLADSLETALKMGEGLVIIDVLGEGEHMFSERFACPQCGMSLEELSPRMFSFNSPYGACSVCDGLGFRQEFDPALYLDPQLSLQQGAFLPWNSSKSRYYMQLLKAVVFHYGIDFHAPIKDISLEKLEVLINGTPEPVEFHYENRRGELRVFHKVFQGFQGHLKERFRETTSEYVRQKLGDYMSVKPCSGCNGERLKPESLAVTIGDHSIARLSSFTIKQAQDFFSRLVLTEKESFIGGQIIKEIQERFRFLINVGLDYLTLDRAAGTLSGGEAQRIRLATQIGSSLAGVLYILDEPSIGLHQKDNRRLIETLERLRDLGNTVIVVEHDEETIRSADHVVDVGPGAGKDGGYIVVQGTVEEVEACRESLTGQYLSGVKAIPIPKERYGPNGKFLEVVGARAHNLKGISVSFPLGTFICVTGVSGSGKSTLVSYILHRRLRQDLYRSTEAPGQHEDLLGIEEIDKVIAIDQSPIGRTPRSNPATYTKVFDSIRDLFALTREAKGRGYKKGRFSFNVKGGRCEACRGDGIIKIEMHFLPDVYVTCEVCQGRRYNRETLEVKYRDQDIANILDMTVAEAREFFSSIPVIGDKLNTLYDVGLGYIRLGQPATTLSGGEAQRIKIARELSKKSTGRTLYLLDEPTTGLHFEDIKRLLLVLGRLREGGNTVVVIEHNLDVIKAADYIIDLGPGGGEGGGEVVAVGTPEEVAQVEESYTGQYLQEVLPLPSTC